MNTYILIFVILFDFITGIKTLINIDRLPRAWQTPFLIAGLGLLIQVLQSISYLLGNHIFYELPLWMLKDIGIGYILITAIKSLKE